MATSSQHVAVPARRTLLSETLKWFGLIGTSFTIFANAGTFIEFSKFVKLWTDQWRMLITGLVNFFTQWFDISVDESIAVIVFSVVSCLIVALSAQTRLTSPWTVLFRVWSTLAAAAFSTVYFCFVMLGPSASDPRMEDDILTYGLISFFISLALAAIVFARKRPERDQRLYTVGLVVFFVIIVLGPISDFGSADFIRDMVSSRWPEWIFFGLLSTLVVTMYFVAQPIAISFRSVGILIVLGCLICLNLFASLLERLGWIA